MKMFFKGSLILMILSISLWSCSSDDNGNDSHDQEDEASAIVGDWVMNGLSFDGATEQEGLGDVNFSGDEKELPDDTFHFDKDGTYKAGTSTMALNVEVGIGEQTLEGEDLADLGIDTNNISPFLTEGKWSVNEEESELTLVENESGEAIVFDIDQLDDNTLKITTADGYPMVKTAGIIPAGIVDALGHIDIEVSMAFEIK